MADEFNPKFAAGDLIVDGSEGDFMPLPFRVVEVSEERGYLLEPDRYVDLGVTGAEHSWPMWLPPLPLIETTYVKVGEA